MFHGQNGISVADQLSGTGMNACDDRGCRRDHRDEDGPDLDKTGDIAGFERSALTGKR
ncbi:hypothetical protein D9M70_432520 [compost metagenome]